MQEYQLDNCTAGYNEPVIFASDAVVSPFCDGVILQ